MFKGKKLKIIGLIVTICACMGFAVDPINAAIKTPINVKATSTDSTTIKVTYSKVAYVSGYNIYRATSKTGKYSYIKTNVGSSSTTFNNTGLTTGKTYYYKVKAYKIVKGKKTYSYYSKVVAGKAVPKTPAISVSVASYNSLSIKMSTQTNIDGYNIYRATSSRGTFSYITSTSRTSYTNNNLTNNKTYYYKVRAYKRVNGKNVYGSYSSIKAATPALLIPKIVVASTLDSIIIINNKVPGATGYRVYRATSKTGTYTQLSVSSNTIYTDAAITKDKTYYYKVRAYKTVGSSTYYSNYSSIVSGIVYDFGYLIDLSAAITAYEELDSSLYVNFDVATSIYNREATTKSEIVKKTTDLNNAIAALIYKSANYSTLNNLLDEVSSLNSNNYTNYEIVSTITDSLIMTKNITEQSYVDQQVSLLRSAIDGLILKDADYSTLNSLVSELNSLTATDYANFDTVTTIINSINYTKKITEQSYVDDLVTSLNEAYDNLILICTVSFNTNGGGEIDNQVLNEGSKVVVPTIPTKTGYDFAGWTLNELPYDFDSEVTGDFTLVGTWTATNYNISYNLAGGGLGLLTNPENYTIATPTIILNNPTREGYDFAGWEKADHSIVTAINLGTTGEISLTATWTAKTYTVTFDSNGGSVVENKIVTYDSAYGTLETPTKDNYEFNGWYTTEENDNGNGTQVEATDIFDVTSNQTLYAKWTPVAYNIIYNLAGGNLGALTNPESYTIATPTITLNNPTKEGYDFAGWEKADHSIVTAINLGTTGEISLTATWTAKTYTVNFDSNSGSVVENKIVTYNSAYGTLETPTKDNYEFNGWYTTEENDNGNGTQVEATDIFDVASNQTLYAKWTPVAYNIIYNLAGGNLGALTNPESYTIETPTITLNNPTKEGYDFAGWEKADHSIATTISLGTTGEISLTATWTAINYNISYNLAGGSLDLLTNPENYTIVTPTITLNNPTKEGYDFAGWEKADHSIVTAINVGTTGDINLTATWTAKTYTITFDSNGGSAIVNRIVTYDDEYGELYGVRTNPIRDGYDFDGWYTAEENDNGTGVKLEETDIVKITSNQTLYAKWSPMDYTIVYNLSGGSLGELTNPESYTIATPTIILNSPTKKGYDFAGWKTVEQDIIYTIPLGTTGYIHLTATWTAKNYTVTFNSNGGSAVENKIVSYFQPYGTLPIPVKENYQFVGWYTHQGNDNNGYGGKIEATTYVAATNDHTLYAKWEEKQESNYYVQYKFENLNGEFVLDSNLKDTSAKIGTIGSSVSVDVEQLPTFVGYTFSSANSTTNLTATVLSNNQTIITVAYARNTHSIKFMINDGENDTLYDELTYKYGADISDYAVNDNYNGSPSKTGYTFSGWYDGGRANVISFTTMPDNDIMVYDKFNENSYTISYNVNGGTGSLENDVVTYNQTIRLKSPDFEITKTGYDFIGWSDSSDAIEAEYPLDGDSLLPEVSKLVETNNGTKTLYAVWVPQIMRVDVYSAHQEPICYMNGEEEVCQYEEDGITLKMQYVLKTTAYPQTVYYNDTLDVNQLTGNDRGPDYVFEGWYEVTPYEEQVCSQEYNNLCWYETRYSYADDEFDFNTRLTSGTTIGAKFSEKVYTLRIYSDNENYVDHQLPATGEYIYNTPAVREGFQFAGLNYSPTVAEHEEAEFMMPGDGQLHIYANDVKANADENKVITLYEIWNSAQINPTNLSITGYGAICQDRDEDGQCDMNGEEILYELDEFDNEREEQNDLNLPIDGNAVNTSSVIDFEKRFKNKFGYEFEGWHEVLIQLAPICAEQPEGLYGEDSNRYYCIGGDKLAYETIDLSNLNLQSETNSIRAVFTEIVYTLRIYSDNENFTDHQLKLSTPYEYTEPSPKQDLVFLGLSNQDNSINPELRVQNEGTLNISLEDVFDIADNNNIIVLYEIWGAEGSNNITITYYANGHQSSNIPETITIPRGSGYNVFHFAPTTSDAGYIFSGWATSSNGAVVYQPGDDLGAVEENIDFYAIWVPFEVPEWFDGSNNYTLSTPEEYAEFLAVLGTMNSSSDPITVTVGDVELDQNIILNSNMTLIANSINLNNASIDNMGTIKVKVNEAGNLNITGAEVVFETGSTLIKLDETGNALETVIGTNGTFTLDDNSSMGVYTDINGTYYNVRLGTVNINKATSIDTLDMSPESTVNINENVTINYGLKSAPDQDGAIINIDENKTLTFSSTVEELNELIVINGTIRDNRE